ncbi:MAG: hypothetical protein LUF27_13005 [Lachnospiraceae bacterium]|nr:hypothetical protein [Lachnospiraceae bacterium]
MVDRTDGKFIAFADVLPMGGYFYDTAPYSLEQAVTEYGLKGLKLHPSNLGIPIDSLEMVPVMAVLGFPSARKTLLKQLLVIWNGYPMARIPKYCAVYPMVSSLAPRILHIGWTKQSTITAKITPSPTLLQKQNAEICFAF